MELKSRKEMNPEFMWDLTHLFKDDEAWKKALADLSPEIDAIKDLAGQLDGCAHCLKRVLDTIFGLYQRIETVYAYAMFKTSGDNGDSDNQAMSQLVMKEAVKFETNMSFLTPEILAIDEDRFMEEYLNNDVLMPYRHFLEDVNRMRAHTLSANEERLLAMLGEVQNGPSNVFRMLSNVDMQYPFVKNEKGEDVQLSFAQFSVLRESGDRSVRKAAFDAFLGAFKALGNSFTALYKNSIMFDKFNAQSKNYSSCREAALFEGNVPVSVYDNLISAVHAGIPTMKRYIELRKRALKLDDVSLYDLYCPILPDSNFTVPYDEGKRLVKNALAPLGEYYASLLDRAYNEGWIDVYENKGKTTGAFSSGVYGVHSFVLLNYADKLDDAFTLAHELGHAMHSYLSNENNDFLNAQYRIFVAEVASTVNEVLLTKYLLKVETDKKRRAFILNNLLESFRTTVFRQTLFAEFELKAHELAETGAPITPEALNGIYHELNSLYYDGAQNPEVFDVEWSWISHFYRPFYVYQYATGFSSAVALATHIFETGDTKDYIAFLSSGGSDYPIELLKRAGVDLNTPAPINAALKLFDDTVTELDALINELD